MSQRPMTERVLLLLLVTTVHVLAILILARFRNLAVETPSTATTPVTVFIQPKLRDSGDNSADSAVSQLTVRVDSLSLRLHIEAPELDFFVSRNEAAGIAAPSLQTDGRTGIERYVREAALLPGEGATVVLRVEVLATGEPGQIEIDTSSGRLQIDQAALDYARTQRWYAGRVNGIPQAMWIRWGVRLQA